MNKKKILAAAVLVALFAPTACANKGPVVTLGGELNSQYSYVKHKDNNEFSNPDSATGDKLTKSYITNSSLVRVKAEGDVHMNNAAPLKVGAVAEFNVDSSNAYDGDSKIGRQTYFYADSAMGRFSIGSQTSASHDLAVDTVNSSCTKETGIGGLWAYKVNPRYGDQGFSTPLFTAQGFLLYPILYADNITVDSTTSDSIYAESTIKARYASKAKFISAKYSGFSFGFDYTPHLNSYGTIHQASSVLDNSLAFNDLILEDNRNVYNHLAYKNVFTGGVNYEYKADNHLQFKIGFTGQTGSSKTVRYATSNYTASIGPITDAFDIYNTKLYKLNAWQAGLEVSYMGFSLSGAYGDNGKSGHRKEVAIITGAPTVVQTVTVTPHDAVKTKFWNAGVAYQHGPIGGYVAYGETKKGFSYVTGGTAPVKNRVQVVTVGVDYKPQIEGVLLSAEVFNYKAKDKFYDHSIFNEYKDPKVSGLALNLKVNV